MKLAQTVFPGVYWENPIKTDARLILMLGDAPLVWKHADRRTGSVYQDA